MFRLVESDCIPECFCVTLRLFSVGVIEFAVHGRFQGRFAVSLLQLDIVAREAALEVRVDLSLARNSDTSEVVCHVGSLKTHKALRLHEGAGLLHWAVVDLLAFIEDEDLIKQVVDAVTSLV